MVESPVSNPPESMPDGDDITDLSQGDYPFTGHYFQLGNHRYHYLDEGEGEPVLMLHGNPSWSIYYRELVHALRGSHRCLVPDHIGCGLSDKPDDSSYDYTLSQRVDDLESFLQNLGVEQGITLIVHDWGGMIGMAYATRHPKAIKRIVILNTAAFHLPETKSFPWALWLCRNTKIGAFFVRRFNAFSYLASHMACKKTPMSKSLRKAYCAPYDSWNNRIATLRFVQDIPLRPGDRGYDLISEVQDSLDQFKNLPVLICWGMKDFVFDHHFLETWIRYWPHAEVHRFPDCGHYILEDAQDKIRGLVQGFIEAHP